MTAKIIPIPNNYIKDITGLEFGRLTVLGYTGKSVNSKAEWLCKCECGNKVVVMSASMLNGRTVSCGCYNTEKRRTHNMYKSSEYNSYHSMLQRCRNPNAPGYKYYGGRGIEVCDDWVDSFESFMSDMGLKPTPKHTIERVDNDAGYSAANCKWATMAEQSINKRRHRNNKSGVIGVSWTSKDKRWCAGIGRGGSSVKLGQYVEWWDAVCARKSAERNFQTKTTGN